MIDQIKAALKGIGDTPWNIGTQSPNGLQNIGRRGVMVCQTFNIEDATFISNAPTYLRYLLDELEKANRKCPDCGGAEIVVMCDDPYYAEPCICTVDWMSKACELAEEMSLIRTEHTAMKETLEWIEECGVDYQSINKARAALSTLKPCTP